MRLTRVLAECKPPYKGLSGQEQGHFQNLKGLPCPKYVCAKMKIMKTRPIVGT